MGIQIQFEPEQNSEFSSGTLREAYLATLTPKARAQQEKRLAKFDIMYAKLETDINPNRMDLRDHGIFSFDLADLQTLLKRAERGSARLLRIQYWVSLLPNWHEEWPFSPTEFYSRLQTRLEAIQTLQEFDWNLLEPVYDGRVKVEHLVAWLLENNQTEAWCKTCQESYRISDLDIYDWTQMGELKGVQYVCPNNHVLLTTNDRVFMGSLSNAPFERVKRELSLEFISQFWEKKR